MAQIQGLIEQKGMMMLEIQGSTNKRQRTRLPRLAIRGPGEKMRVGINEDGRFIGDYYRECVSAIGMWLKQKEHIPVAVDQFEDIPTEKIERFIQLVKDHYEFEDNEETVKKAILFQLRKSFTTYRHTLHKHYLKIGNHEDAKTKPHPYVTDKDDWTFLCNYWIGDKFKEISERNKSNRSFQEMGHSNASVSFAQTKEKSIQKGEKVDRLTMFFRTHQKKKDQSPTDEASRIAMEKMQTLLTQVSEGTSEFTPDQIFIGAMGEDRHGRIRGVGAGPTKTTYYGRQRSNASQLKEQLQKANDKIEEANVKILEQAKDIEFMKRQLSILMRGQTIGEMDQTSGGTNQTSEDEHEIEENVEGLY